MLMFADDAVHDIGNVEQSSMRGGGVSSTVSHFK